MTSFLWYNRFEVICVKIVVICENCGRLAPKRFAPNGEIEWIWDNPCEYCGEEQWASHDPTLDWKTGKPLDE